jgi:RimJ/RimL family protein N-acetyltransferase
MFSLNVNPQIITFRKLQMDDLVLMHAWLNSPHVSRWYGSGDYTFEQIFEKYAPRIRGETPVHPNIILHAGDPIGYIQTYRISDHPYYNVHVGADTHTAGVDLFIGQADFLHKGYGTAALRKFLEEVVFTDESFTSCVVGPEPDNKAAIRCYEKVGFKYWKTIHIPEEPQDESLMRFSREELAAKH